MLTRYSRTQFVDPNINGDHLTVDKERLSSEEREDEGEEVVEMKHEPASLDPDHRLLLRNTKPLLQSRNASVLFSLVQFMKEDEHYLCYSFLGCHGRCSVVLSPGSQM